MAEQAQRGLIETSRGVQPCNFRLLKGRRYATVSFSGGREYTYPANIILPSSQAFGLANSQAGSRYVAGMYVWGEDGEAVTCSHPINRSRSHRLVWTGERWECSCEYFKRYCQQHPADMCKHGHAAELVLRGEEMSGDKIAASVYTASGEGAERVPYTEIRAEDW